MNVCGNYIVKEASKENDDYVFDGYDVNDHLRFVLDSDDFHNYKDVKYVRLVYRGGGFHCDGGVCVAKEFDYDSRRVYADRFCDGVVGHVQEYRFLCMLGRCDIGRLRLYGLGYVVEERILRSDMYDWPQLYFKIKRGKKGLLNLLMYHNKTNELFRTYKLKETWAFSDHKEIDRC